MKPTNVELHVEELVLHGFQPGDRYEIALAVERELARVLTERGIPPSFAEGLTVEHLDAGAFNVAPSSTPQSVGEQVGQALYEGLSR